MEGRATCRLSPDSAALSSGIDTSSRSHCVGSSYVTAYSSSIAAIAIGANPRQISMARRTRTEMTEMRSDSLRCRQSA